MLVGWRRIASFIVPIVGKQQVNSYLKQVWPPLDNFRENRLLRHNWKVTEPFAVVKPGRYLGAPWIDNYVARRRNVNLCDECQMKYGNWYERYNYAADNVRWISDCDGCGEKIIACGGFYPGENVKKILHRRFIKAVGR